MAWLESWTDTVKENQKWAMPVIGIFLILFIYGNGEVPFFGIVNNWVAIGAVGMGGIIFYILRQEIRKIEAEIEAIKTPVVQGPKKLPNQITPHNAQPFEFVRGNEDGDK